MGNTQQKLPQIPPIQQLELLQQQHDNYDVEEENREFTCEICIEPTINPDKKFNNTTKCSHPFCTDCMIKYIQVKLEDDNNGTIKCPALSCDHTLDPHACASLIGPSLFMRWCDVLCEETIVKFDRCYCPYRNCNVVIVNECGGSVKKSNCPNCRRWFCFDCKRVWHAGFRCEESGETMDRNDVAFGMLVERNKWVRCPRCRYCIERRDGCAIVKCRCKISFCYKCGKQVHRHWCSCDKDPLMCCLLFYRILLILFLVALGVLFLALEGKNY